MTLAVGTILVLLTWVVAIGVAVTLGMPAALLVSPNSARLCLIRVSIWWGLLVAACAATLLNIAEPLHSALTAFVLVLLVVALGIPGWYFWTRRRRGSGRIGPGWWLALVAVAIAQVFLAMAALGRVTGYDTGLYHLSAVQFAAEYATIPGLANLHSPLGYSTVEFPLAALMGNGPWDGEGFRLLNGLVLGLVSLELVLRLMRRSKTVGLYVLLAGVAAALVPMVAMSDAWVTSPSQDCMVLALTVVSAAYLADAVAGGKHWTRDAITALACSVLLVMVRTTMLAFLLASVAVVAVLLVRRRGGFRASAGFRPFAPLIALTAVAGVAVGLRDYVLSGWLQFPLSVLAFDVPWRAADPTPLRVVTLGFHRNPSRMWEAGTGADWEGAWFSRLPTQWETYQVLAMAAAGILVLMTAYSYAVRPHRTTAMLLTMVPSAAGVVVWWTVSPPAFRFVWGPLFMLFAIPIGWALWLLCRTGARSRTWQRLAAVGFAVPILMVTFYSAAARLDPSAMTAERYWSFGVVVPYWVTPVRDVPFGESMLPSGLTVMVPVDSDQCWGLFPLCSPAPAPGLRQLGESLEDGFAAP